jgi:hypothetical protein
VFIFYYVVEEILELHNHRLRYLNNIWNILDLVVILVREDIWTWDILEGGRASTLVGALSSALWNLKPSSPLLSKSLTPTAPPFPSGSTLGKPCLHIFFPVILAPLSSLCT